MISLAFRVWTLLSDDLSSVIFGQSTLTIKLPSLSLPMDHDPLALGYTEHRGPGTVSKILYFSVRVRVDQQITFLLSIFF